MVKCSHLDLHSNDDGAELSVQLLQYHQPLQSQTAQPADDTSHRTVRAMLVRLPATKPTPPVNSCLKMIKVSIYRNKKQVFVFLSRHSVVEDWSTSQQTDVHVTCLEGDGGNCSTDLLFAFVVRKQPSLDGAGQSGPTSTGLHPRDWTEGGDQSLGLTLYE